MKETEDGQQLAFTPGSSVGVNWPPTLKIFFNMNNGKGL